MNNGRKKNSFYGQIRIFFVVGARPFHLPVVTPDDYSKTLD